MTSTPNPREHEMDAAHRQAVTAAVNGLQDAALGSARVAGPAVCLLAEAAVSSATPFLRAPLLSQISKVRWLHPLEGDDYGRCPECGVLAPCPTAAALRTR